MQFSSFLAPQKLATVISYWTAIMDQINLYSVTL